MIKSQKKENLSNSRLRVHILNLSDKQKGNYCDVKIDRICITGIFFPKHFQSILAANNWQHTKTYQYSLIRNNSSTTRATVATLTRNQHLPDSWRMDTSNHLQGQEKQQIRNIIKLFANPHITRIDIAFDFINFDHSGMLNKFTKTNVSGEVHTGRGGAIETIYCGKPGSKKVYRYYDKKKERQGHSIPAYIESWERLELEVRGNEAEHWQANAKEMLKQFKRPSLTDVANDSINDYIYSVALLDHPQLKPLLAKATKAKYNKYLKSKKGFDDAYSVAAMKELIRKGDQLTREIESFLD